MAILKCKMCGGDLNIVEGNPICECEFCGTTQTVPQADNEKKANLFNRANRLRMNADFDRAASVYASITAEFPEEAEAFWGLCLCKYGIEYVDDPATGNKIPTCHRTLSESILDDEDFIQACENADPVAKRVYREEAKAIDRLQQDILSIVANESPYDVFICYKETDENGSRTEDSVLAQDIYDSLTGKGLKVFFARITLEDKLGRQYEPYIYAALHSAKVMLAVGTQFDYYDAVWVKNEWARFLDMMKTDREKTLIPCYKGIDAYDMPREFKNLQAQDMGKLGWLQDLTRGVMKLCGKDKEKLAAVPQAVQSGNPNAESLLRRAYVFLEDQDWAHADEYADKVLDLDVSNGYAYLVKLLSDLRLKRMEDLSSLNDCFDHNAHFKKIQRFGNEELNKKMEAALQAIHVRKESKILNQYRDQLRKARTEDDVSRIKSAIQNVKNFAETDEVLAACESKYAILRKTKEQVHEFGNELKQAEQQYRSAILAFDQAQDELASTQKRKKESENRLSICQRELERLQGKVFSTKRRMELQQSILEEKNTYSTFLNQIEAMQKTIQQRQEEKEAEKKKWQTFVYKTAGIYYQAELYIDALIEYKKIPDYQDALSLAATDPHLVEAEKEVNFLALKKKGSIVHFGAFRQSSNEEKKSIDWIVLDAQGTESLLISKSCLFVKEYYSIDYGHVTWEKSILRDWLNEQFLQEAFSKDELDAIIPQMKHETINNQSKAKEDKVFLLTETDVQKYFQDKTLLAAEPTEYAESMNCFIDQSLHTCYWWLREDNSSADSIPAIGTKGTLDRVTANSSGIAVRPALWISNNRILT